MKPHRLSFIPALLLFACILPLNAHAYLDPGSGSYFFQILIGFLLTALFSLKLMWARVVESVKGLYALVFRRPPRTPR